MNPDVLLFRQINPGFLQDGRPTSQPFRPSKKDEGLLSTYDGSMISPKDSWIHYTAGNLQSAGVMAFKVAECVAVQLVAKPDPDTFKEHVVIDFNGLSKGQCESKGKYLQACAQSRNWLFQPTELDDDEDD